jgi:hypothetical protein
VVFFLLLLREPQAILRVLGGELFLQDAVMPIYGLVLEANPAKDQRGGSLRDAEARREKLLGSRLGQVFECRCFEGRATRLFAGIGSTNTL